MTIKERKEYAMEVMVKGVEEAVKSDKTIVMFNRDDTNFDDGLLLTLGELGLTSVENEREVLHKMSRLISDKIDHYVVLQILEDVIRGVIIR